MVHEWRGHFRLDIRTNVHKRQLVDQLSDRRRSVFGVRTCFDIHKPVGLLTVCPARYLWAHQRKMKLNTVLQHRRDPEESIRHQPQRD